MTLQDFLNKYNGKPCEVVDSSSPNQCFDLVVAFTDGLSIPRIFPYKYAYQIYTDFGTEQAKYFDRIYNGPNDVAKEGDIIVWSYYYNYAGGHTGICKSADLYNLEVFEQNDPFGSYCHLQNYKYDHILGWLRPKNYSPALSPDKMIKTIKDKINTQISDSDFRNWERQFLQV